MSRGNAADGMNARTEFEVALMADRIAARYAMEHDSPAALKKYLQEHPDADRKNHHVKKKSPATESKNPYTDAKVERAMGKAPAESEKALKRLHRLKERSGRSDPSKSDEFRAEGRKVHESLLGQAEGLVKAIRGFMDAKGDVEADSPKRMHAVETAVDYMSKLEQQISKSKKQGDGAFLSQIVEDAEELHAAIQNAASTMLVVTKG